MRWSWAVRRAAAGADPPRRLGLPDRRFGQRSQTPAPARAASGRGLPCSRRHLAARGGQAMTATVLGIADDRALGSSLRLMVTRPQSLAAAKAAVDDVIRAVDVAASRFRDDSELTMLNARPDQVTIVSPLLASAIAAALRGAELTGGAVDPTIGAAIRLVGYDGGVASSGTAVRRWLRGGVELHHIIDPATGLPAESCWRSATVVAGSCVDANIASTGAIVMSEKAVPWLVLNRMAARLVRRDGSVDRIAGWPVPVKSKLIPTIL